MSRVTQPAIQIPVELAIALAAPFARGRLRLAEPAMRPMALLHMRGGRYVAEASYVAHTQTVLFALAVRPRETPRPGLTPPPAEEDL